ncbi:hypothetical protein CC80DRAFT_78713 [Byssothecium circinans]|uniref:Uncharacterized protein n=1 Tax=Byssothecium circinans TaxID=147558 RepID=A0A6A5TTM2_9PLEO|nr:hypothetical protein CC80DRAFT_78713 [Byssothecium circinans]
MRLQFISYVPISASGVPALAASFLPLTPHISTITVTGVTAPLPINPHHTSPNSRTLHHVRGRMTEL